MAASTGPGGLAVRSLTKRYGQLLAVDGLSFDVGPGEVLALLGPNGAGKTTTLLCIAGLLRPDAGTLYWRQRPLGPTRGRQVALIAETPEVYELLTVWEHLVFVARSCRLGPGWQGRAQNLVDRLGLGPHRDKLGSALSKGMRQKLLVAAAVLADTPVLLLDEPMVGLDPRGQRELKDLLLELKHEGRSLIVSTHLLEYIEASCDRVLILKEGRAVASSPLAELLAQRPGERLEDVFLEIVS